MRCLAPVIASLALVASTAQAGPPVPFFQARPNAPAVSADDAVAIFQEICVDTAPGFADAPRRIAAANFRFDRERGVHTHRRLDLNIALFDDEGHAACGIMFRPREPVNPTGYALSEAGRGRVYVDVTIMSSGGEIYMVAKVVSP